MQPNNRKNSVAKYNSPDKKDVAKYNLPDKKDVAKYNSLKALRLLGLARRAGKLVCGSDAVKEAAGRAWLILISNDAGRSVRRESARYGKQVAELPYGKEELGRAVGREQCAVAAVIDEEFSQGIAEALLQMEES